MAAVTIIRENGERLSLDAVLRFAASPENLVTQHPLEDGSFVSDHIQTLPETITFSGPVSETALDARQAFPNDPNRPARVRDFLRACSGETVTVVSSTLGTYRNMALVRYPHEIKTRRGIEFTLVLKEIRIGVRSVILAPLAPTQDVGKQPTTTPSDPPEAERASKLFNLGNYTGVFR